MFSFISKILSWIRSVYSESDGSGSSTRVHIGVILAFVIGVGVSFGVAANQKKITIDQFNSFLNTAGAFIVTTAGTLYGVNQIGNQVGNYINTKNNKQPGA